MTMIDSRMNLKIALMAHQIKMNRRMFPILKRDVPVLAVVNGEWKTGPLGLIEKEKNK